MTPEAQPIVPTIEKARMSPVKLLTPEEVAALLGIARQTLARWRMARSGPPFCKVGRLVRYCAADLEAWLDSKRMLSGQQASLRGRGGH